ncbi:MAG: SRPBCC family protein [Rhodobacteraceae bacterium]|nr:SRPBCC family protein [Paracoccaceae bacterium]TVR49036.1 MAG: polyketide cyclase [Paracoccaceae bacterium]
MIPNPTCCSLPWTTPHALLWKCWTTPEHIKQVVVPKPHRVTHCEIDLRVGGRFNTVFSVEGAEMKNEGVWLEIVPDEKLVFTDFDTEGWAPSEDSFMTAIILFEDAPGGGTRYTAIARHRTPESRQSHEDMGFCGGWATVADQLVAYARTLGR